MKKILTFIAGLGLGVAISWTYHKNKYEEMIQEEVDSLREMSKKVTKDDENEKKTCPEDTTTDDELDEAKVIIQYNKYSKTEDVIPSKTEEMGPCEREANRNPIFVITPDEFASEPGYDTDTFYIHANDVVVNDNFEVVKDVVGTLGLTVKEIREQFGIYEDNAVYVRDVKINMDYEILIDLDIYKKRDDV